MQVEKMRKYQPYITKLAQVIWKRGILIRFKQNSRSGSFQKGRVTTGSSNTASKHKNLAQFRIFTFTEITKINFVAALCNCRQSPRHCSRQHNLLPLHRHPPLPSPSSHWRWIFFHVVSLFPTLLAVSSWGGFLSQNSDPGGFLVYLMTRGSVRTTDTN